MKLSARNQITGTVTSVVSGEAATVVHIDAGGTKLVSSITTEAAKDLGLAEGMTVTAIIKASDVLVAVD